MIFNGRFTRTIRVVASVTAAAMVWLSGPAAAFAKGRPAPVLKSRLRAGLTDKITPEMQRKIDARQAAAAAKPKADVRVLSQKEMRGMSGRGPLRNASFSGTLPWQRSLRDVNLCNGNLFKSFTDIQVAPARGAGLALQRTYNSNDDRIGPFGVGWTHAYDIRMDEAGVNPSTQSEQTKRTDFFGAKHTYTRDADGLYTPPAYMFDELSSNYDTFLASGPSAPLDDSQKGMDGTVKHFIDGGTNPDGSVNHNERVCDSITDRHGNQTVLTYGLTVTMADGSGKKLLTKVTDPSGRSLIFTWTDLGTTPGAPAFRITQVQGPVDSSGTAVGGVTYRVVYSYGSDPSNADTYQNLTSVTLDPDGLNRTTTYTYTNCSGSYTDPTTMATSTVTENGLLASVSDPLGHTVSYTYGMYCLGGFDIDAGAYAGFEVPTGTVWVTSITEPGSGGNVVWNLFGATSGHFDWTSGTLLGSGLNTIYQSNALINVGISADQFLRVTETFASDDSSINRGYYTQYDSANNAVVSVSNQNALYNPRWSPEYYSSNAARETDSTYGPHGNLLTSKVAGFSGTATTTYYDASKYFQKASVTDMNGHTSTFDYYADDDASVGNRGEVKWVRDANYATTGAQFTYTYNSFGQKTSETNLNGVVTTYTYGDTLGNLTQVVQDPSTTSPAYTGLNRTTNMSYDYAGHVISSTDPNGNTSSFSYNTLGQPTSASFPAVGTSTAAETVSYAYAANGRTSSVSDNRGTTTMSYETGNDRVSSVTDPVTGTMSYTYLLCGARSSVTLPDGKTWTYNYAEQGCGYDFYDGTNDNSDLDDSGLSEDQYWLPKDDPNSVTLALARITDDQGRVVDFAVNGDGRPNTAIFDQTYNTSGSLTGFAETGTSYDAITDSSYNYYGHGWLAELKTTFTTISSGGAFTTGLLHQNDYTYDLDGQRLSNQIHWTGSGGSVTSRTESYGYDSLNRLTSVSYGDGQTQGYGFDAMGNRSTKSDSSTGSESYLCDAANRLTSKTLGGSTHSVSSDANGNTLNDGTRTNVWDSQNRLVSCASSAGGSATTSAFTYGSDGLRRRGTVTASDGTSTRTNYVYDGSMVVEEIIQHFNSSGTALDTPTTISYLQGPQGPLYRKSSAVADPSWYVYDGLGSVVGEVDVNGNLTASKLFDVYGLTRSVSGTPTTRQGFVGGLGHESDDETGLVYMRARYYDPGTGRFVSEDPSANGENWFAYCGGDPVNKADFDGKKPYYQPWQPDFVLAGFGFLIASIGLMTVTGTGISSALSHNAATAAVMGLALAAVFCFAISFINNGTFAQQVIEISSFGSGIVGLVSTVVANMSEASNVKYPGLSVALYACYAESLYIVGCLAADDISAA